MRINGFKNTHTVDMFAPNDLKCGHNIPEILCIQLKNVSNEYSLSYIIFLIV